MWVPGDELDLLDRVLSPLPLQGPLQPAAREDVSSPKWHRPPH